jgi:hypothetical protein
LGEDGMAQRAREIAAFLGIVNFEDQFHIPGMPEAEESAEFSSRAILSFRNQPVRFKPSLMACLSTVW